jgi:hypothetical protein
MIKLLLDNNFLNRLLHPYPSTSMRYLYLPISFLHLRVCMRSAKIADCLA